MTTALIGHTGFVGGNLQRQFPFDDCYHSADIHRIEGRSYDLVVCAGAPGVKWKANQDPYGDWHSVSNLMTHLRSVDTAAMVLISTVDVYPSPLEVDEDTHPRESDVSPYGRHRLLLEHFVESRFPSTIVRLPALFGSGLKKNVIYDLLHNNALTAISPESVYQFYPLDRLWPDIARARSLGIRLLNVATEGLSVRDLAREAFGIEFENAAPPKPVRYDFRSRHAESLGGSGGYLYHRSSVLGALQSFVQESR